MPRYGQLFSALVLAAAELMASGCGSGSQRLLQSVTVTPATANAQMFANGQVQFTANGNYSQPPTPSTLPQASWLISDGNIATISQTGLAQCIAGASGTVTVKGGTSGSCSGSDCTAIFVSGNAQLTCP